MATLEGSAKVAHFELSMGDYNAMLRHASAPGPRERLLWFGVVFLGSFGVVLFGRYGIAFVAGLVAGFLMLSIKMLQARHRLQPRPEGALLCHHDVALTEKGVHTQTPTWTGEWTWHAILDVEETAEHCFLRVDTVSLYTIPKRSFPNSEAMRQFVDFARDGVSRAKATAPVPRA